MSSSINISDLSVDNQVFLTALLQAIPFGSNEFSYSELLENRFTPSPYLTVSVLRELISCGVVKLIGSPLGLEKNLDLNNCLDASFRLHDKITVLAHQQLFNDILNKSLSDALDSSRLIKVTKDAFVAECVEYISDITNTYIEEGTVTSSTTIPIEEMLREHSISQVMNLLFLAAIQYPKNRFKAPNAVVLASMSNQALEFSQGAMKKGQRVSQAAPVTERPSVLTILLTEGCMRLKKGDYFNLQPSQIFENLEFY